jgi:hypothetical protein
MKSYTDEELKEWVRISEYPLDDAEGEMVTFSSTEGFPFDDMMEYSDFKDTVNEIVNEFISELVEAFGFDLGRDIGIISVDHYMYT